MENDCTAWFLLGICIGALFVMFTALVAGWLTKNIGIEPTVTNPITKKEDVEEYFNFDLDGADYD